MEQDKLLRAIDYGIAPVYEVEHNTGDDLLDKIECGIQFIRECADINDYILSSDNYMIRENITKTVKKVVDWIIALFKKLGDSLKTLWNKYTKKDAEGLRKRAAVLTSDFNVIQKNKTSSTIAVYFATLPIRDIGTFLMNSYDINVWLSLDVSKKGEGDASLNKTLEVCSRNIKAFSEDADEQSLKVVQDAILSLQTSLKSNDGKSSNNNLNIFFAKCENDIKPLIRDVSKIKNIGNVGSLMFDIKEEKTTPTKLFNDINNYTLVPKFVDSVIALADKNIIALENFDKEVYKMLDTIGGQKVVDEEEKSKEEPKDEPKQLEAPKETIKENDESEDEKNKPTVEMNKTADTLNQLLASAKTIASVSYDVSALWDTIITKVLSNSETYAKLLIKYK